MWQCIHRESTTATYRWLMTSDIAMAALWHRVTDRQRLTDAHTKGSSTAIVSISRIWWQQKPSLQSHFSLELGLRLCGSWEPIFVSASFNRSTLARFTIASLATSSDWPLKLFVFNLVFNPWNLMKNTHISKIKQEVPLQVQPFSLWTLFHAVASLWTTT